MTDIVINNALSAKLRLLHKRLLKWDSTRLRDALVVWAEGVLIPGVCVDPASGDSIPCAYTEVYGANQDAVLALTSYGVYRGTFKELGLPKGILSHWEESTSAKEDALKLEQVLVNHPLDSMLVSTNYYLPDSLIKRSGLNVIRYSQGPRLDGRYIDTPIPEFPDQQTCFEWIAFTEKSGNVTYANKFFETLLEIPQVVTWLKDDSDWVQLTTYLPFINLDDIDRLSCLPTEAQPFMDWLVDRGRHRDGNLQTFLKLGLNGIIAEGKMPDKLIGLLAAWRADDEDQFRRARGVIRNWTDLLPIICEYQPPGSCITKVLWSYYSEYPEKADEAANIARLLDQHGIFPESSWLEMMERHINSNRVTYSDLPEKWADEALRVYFDDTSLYAPRSVLNYLEPYFCSDKKKNDFHTFSEIITKFPNGSQLFDLENFVITYANKVWPESKKIWDVISSLDIPFPQWRDLLISATPKNAEVGDLPEVGLSNYDL